MMIVPRYSVGDRVRIVSKDVTAVIKVVNIKGGEPLYLLEFDEYIPRYNSITDDGSSWPAYGGSMYQGWSLEKGMELDYMYYRDEKLKVLGIV